MTELIFSFDTEDFTSNRAADAIKREAEIFREEGVRGCFCIVGLLADQLKAWGRDDVISELRHHEIATHSLSHSMHPLINEYTDTENFSEAFDRAVSEERLAIQKIREVTGADKIFAAVPPGNQKSYAAMYAYASLGIPIYADTFSDTADGRGAYYCNLYNISYTASMEGAFMNGGEAEIDRLLDLAASCRRAIIYTHPNIAIFDGWWDGLNYKKENLAEFGKWKSASERPSERTERFYDNIRLMLKKAKRDPRFKITTYSEIAERLAALAEREITIEDVPHIRKSLSEKLYPISSPTSLSLSDLMLGARDLLLGKSRHVCGFVYGFLDTPYGIRDNLTLSREEIILGASEIRDGEFLPEKIHCGGKLIGPADWLYGAIEILSGAETVTLSPRDQLPSLDELPATRDASFAGTWMHSDEFEDKFLSKRLRLQSYTMRFL